MSIILYECEFCYTDTSDCELSVGFEILAFPCNQFLEQEPGSSEEIHKFACTKFKAEFPIFRKVITVIFLFELSNLLTFFILFYCTILSGESREE